MSESSNFDFQTGEILLVDKPLNWTSFQVVNKLRWEIRQKLGIKKIKVGHAGTLDPLATGLLVLCTGKSTKQIEHLMGGTKTYTGTITLGATTPSFDLETEIDHTFDIEHINESMLQNAALDHTGEQLQLPPIFSAKKVDGKRAYESARAGEEVELKKNLITVHEFNIQTEKFPIIDFEIKCSKGTYIRSLAHDFGRALRSGAHLSSLRRTASGSHDISQAFTLEEWIDMIKNS